VERLAGTFIHRGNALAMLRVCRSIGTFDDEWFHSCDSDDCNYESGFTFECHLLSNDTNKSKKGYPVSIIICSDNSASWVHSLATIFSEKVFPPTVLV
jgi:hypothetical protein